jgi:hypothetical protein
MKSRFVSTPTPRSGSGRSLIARKAAWPIVVLCLFVSLAGCTPKLYSVDMRYTPTKIIEPAQNDGRKYSLTVAALVDQRKMEDNLLLGRVIESDGTPIPVLPKYVKATDAVAQALREVLTRAGYSVSPVKPAWDLEERTIRPEWGTLLVGGSIEALDVTCVESTTMKKYTAKVRVSLAFADVRKKRIFYRVTSESSASLDHILFSEEKLEEQINGALSDAMEKILEGPETAKRIREALKP